MPDGRAGGSGGEGGGADAARAESARQALLLATQTLGVNAADVQAARAEREAARASMEWLADELLKDRSREKVLEDAVREGHDEAVGCMLRRGADHPRPTRTCKTVDARIFIWARPPTNSAEIEWNRVGARVRAMVPLPLRRWVKS